MADITDEELLEMAREEYASDDIEINDGALVSRGEDGAFVAAWVWVRYPEEVIDACENCGNTLNDGSDICDQCGGAFE